MSRARQREQAESLVRGHGQVVTEFSDEGESRTVAWGHRPQAAALVAPLADPDRVWDAIVVGEYERAFPGSQYAIMALRSGTTAGHNKPYFSPERRLIALDWFGQTSSGRPVRFEPTPGASRG